MEPGPQILIAGRLAGGVDGGLDGLGVGIGRQRADGRDERRDMARLLVTWPPVGFVRAHAVLIIGDGIADHPVEFGMRFGADPGRIGADIVPDHVGRLGKAYRGKVQQQRVADRQAVGGRRAGMDMPGRVLQQFGRCLRRRLAAMLVIFVDCLRDHVEMQPLGAARLGIHEQ